MTSGTETWDMKMGERHKLDVMERKNFQTDQDGNIDGELRW